MRGDVDEIRRGMLARVTAAFAAEIDAYAPGADVPWPLWPDVAALIDHLGGNHLWAAAIVRGGDRVDRSTITAAPADGIRAWYEGCRAELLAALADAGPDDQCWIIGAGAGSPTFWGRRMLYETTKHLIDIRASGGGTMVVAPELAPVDYADGIDELFAVFLPRSEPGLPRLAAPVELRAIDLERTWHVGRDWTVSDTPAHDESPVVVSASAGDLALAVWERADPLDGSGRFTIDGDASVVAAFRAAPIHP